MRVTSAAASLVSSRPSQTASPVTRYLTLHAVAHW
jgi:hypothetical protein